MLSRVDIEPQNILLELPHNVSAQLPIEDHGPWAGGPPPGSWASHSAETEVAIPESSARFRDSEYIQVNVKEEQYSSLMIKLVDFGHGRTLTGLSNV